ncbi:MAG: Heme-binding protein, partial [Pseudomonadota bacterium]
MKLLRAFSHALCVVAMALGATAHAAPLRIGSANDPQTMDPHAVALLYNSRIYTQVYEGLVWRDEQFRLEPALATSWQMTGPTTWRFKLRAGVTFHDGAPFGADDVVFSIERALAPPSERAFQLKGITAVKKVDELTVDFQLAAPDAVLPEKLVALAMMNKAWCVKNKVTLAQNYNARQETFA